MLNLSTQVRSRTMPFLLFQADGLVGAEDVDLLQKTAPTRMAQLIAVDDAAHEKQYRMHLYRLAEGDRPENLPDDLDPRWQALLDDLMSAEFTTWLQDRTGIRLVGLPRSVGVYAHRNGDYLAVHKDKPTKAITAIIYLNRSWPAEAGGRFQIFDRGGADASPIDEIMPIGGQFLAFPPTDRSWHAVSEITHPDRTERLTVQIEYWLTTELMGTTYRGGAEASGPKGGDR